jgi:hypothetical protein
MIKYTWERWVSRAWLAFTAPHDAKSVPSSQDYSCEAITEDVL